MNQPHSPTEAAAWASPIRLGDRTKPMTHRTTVATSHATTTPIEMAAATTSASKALPQEEFLRDDASLCGDEGRDGRAGSGQAVLGVTATTTMQARATSRMTGHAVATPTASA